MIVFRDRDRNRANVKLLARLINLNKVQVCPEANTGFSSYSRLLIKLTTRKLNQLNKIRHAGPEILDSAFRKFFES